MPPATGQEVMSLCDEASKKEDVHHYGAMENGYASDAAGGRAAAAEKSMTEATNRGPNRGQMK